MERKMLSKDQIHPAAYKFITENNIATIDEIISAITKNKIVVVGMSQNPVVKKARKILEVRKMEYTYLSYGSYFSKWKQRLAIKLWSGWPTYPQIFIDGKLIGGCSDLIKFLEN